VKLTHVNASLVDCGHGSKNGQTGRFPMRITIDASSLSYPKRTGIGRCLESILPYLASMAAGQDAIILVSGQPIVNETALDLLSQGLLTAQTVNMPSLYAWQQTGMAWQLKRIAPDVHYAPDGLLPFGFRGKSVGVIHDILWKRFPQTLRPHIRLVFALRQRASLQRFTIPLTISAFTRNELIQAYGPMANRVRPRRLNAVDKDRFRPAIDADAPAIADFLARQGLQRGYVLAVGNLMPHKNLSVALRAIARMNRSEGAPKQRLAIVGHGNADAVMALLPRSADPETVVCLGYLSDDDVTLAYRAASVFVFPSRYEGFGMPLLEAMASGLPVAYADAASLPETAGDAGLSFPADDDEALADILGRLRDDPDLRQRQIALGHTQVADFSWETCAQNVYEALLEASGHPSSRLYKGMIVTPSSNFEVSPLSPSSAATHQAGGFANKHRQAS
jgi:glycosyltransferase involved in cell wall biosynthesis